VKVLVCGGIEYSDYAAVREAIMAKVTEHVDEEDVIVIHGGARGADSLADRAAIEIGVHVCRVPALWDTFGPKAGPLRNLAMLQLMPDVVLAFPGGRGTAHMVGAARRMGVPVEHYGAKE
jgi:hypothetical protein